MTKLKCFVIMPFRRDFDPVFRVVREAVENAVPGEKIQCSWLKEIQAAGRITDDILDALQDATLAVADVTSCNPNVMWETGYAMALGKPTLLIGQMTSDLPFDLKVHRVIPYDPATLADFGTHLAEAVRQTLAKYEFKSKLRMSKSVESVNQTVVVTGSSRADPARVWRRIKTLLRPYLGTGVLWYCGSTGIVDESAVKYLLEHKERVMAVAYHRFDFSEGIRTLVQREKLQFIDASIEAVPKTVAGPSQRDIVSCTKADRRRLRDIVGRTERDIFFCAKADLVVLFWDGESRNTQRLIQYFQENGKNLIIGFI